MTGDSVLRVRGVELRNRSSWLTVWWFFPLIIGLLVLSLYVTVAIGFEADLWFNDFAPVMVPIVIVGLGVLAPIVTFRVLQVFGLVGVVYVRAFGDGSALVGSWWRVRRGHGLVVDRASEVTVEVVETMPKTLGWRTDTGIPVYMRWTVESDSRRFSWLTPFDAAPDAADRITSVLASLSEPACESLSMSQAARAA